MERRARASTSEFGGALREWRTLRGKSQLRLALDAGVSSRHLSFLESGRASPSRDMVLTLAQALELPLRDCNRLLEAAGFAAAYRESPLDSGEMAVVWRALEATLRANPYPTIVVDRRSRLLIANEPAKRLYVFFCGAPPPSAGTNALEILGSLRPYLENWEELGRIMLARARRERMPEEVRASLAAAMGLTHDAPLPASIEEAASAPAVPVRLRKGEIALSLFTMITTAGTPQDITLQELRMETLFPMEARSERLLAALGEVEDASPS